MKHIQRTAAIALLGALAACGGSEPSTDDMLNDASDVAAKVDQASADLSNDLRAAAAASGDMPCELPTLPDAGTAQPMSQPGGTFTTSSTPEQTAAFYLEAAKARGGNAKADGPPGMSFVELALGESGNCKVVAQAQMGGGTNVQITNQ